MRASPGFLSELYEQLESLSEETLCRVNRSGGLEISDMIELITNPRDLSVSESEEVKDEDLERSEEFTSESFWLGRDLLTNGMAAHCIICDERHLLNQHESSISLLELQLMRLSWVKEVWVLVSPSHEVRAKKIRDSVGSKASIITNYETLHLRPDNLLEFKDGNPELSTCGNGDLINSMRSSEIYEKFIQEGGKYIVASHGENFLGARPAILGSHALSQKPVTCEVTKRSTGENKNSILCDFAGFNQLVEPFRFSFKEEYESYLYEDAGIIVFNTSLDFDSFKWKWHRRKKIVSNRAIVQFERSLCDLTANFQTQFIYTPRKYLK